MSSSLTSGTSIDTKVISLILVFLFEALTQSIPMDINKFFKIVDKLLYYKMLNPLYDLISRGLSWIYYNVKISPIRIKLFWHRLWIRKDEFHSSLNMDANIYLVLEEKDRDYYVKDLTRRRGIAHKRDMERSDKKENE